MDGKNKIKFKINGSEFVISAEEDKEYITRISKMVDDRIDHLSKESKHLSNSMITVLAALNYCDELEKQKKITAELLIRTEESTSAAKRAQENLETFAVENEQLKEEKKGLHARIEELKAELGARQGSSVQRPQETRSDQRHTQAQNHKNNNNYNRNMPKSSPVQRQVQQNPPKINYQENDKISEQYRRADFADPATEDEMLSFFDNR